MYECIIISPPLEFSTFLYILNNIAKKSLQIILCTDLLLFKSHFLEGHRKVKQHALLQVFPKFFSRMHVPIPYGMPAFKHPLYHKGFPLRDIFDITLKSYITFLIYICICSFDSWLYEKCNRDNIFEIHYCLFPFCTSFYMILLLSSQRHPMLWGSLGLLE